MNIKDLVESTDIESIEDVIKLHLEITSNLIPSSFAIVSFVRRSAVHPGGAFLWSGKVSAKVVQMFT